ncbi:MAG: serine/threonine protein kinase [Polyangiaceae bacterium]|nr:serine/threonine protein kinase [Polyangiaceae bacterium]
MKGCAKCHRLYADDIGVCPVEGATLESTDKLRPEPDPEDPRVGNAICYGRYEIWRVLADGAMGRVYQALDRARDRTVALKVLHARISEDQVALARFHREFEISARVAHEHIVEIYAFELDPAGNRVLVMEYLEGEALRTLLKRQRVLPPERVIRMLAQMAKGLRVAHDLNLVHRDLKPDNIFLCASREGDVVKILDFGSIRDNSLGAKRITVVGTTIGSPYYMSPEQAQGAAELDSRADVWSMAAIAYEAITGNVPFDGVGDGAILHSIVNRPHRLPSDVGKAYGVPRALDAVMDDALAKSPANRTASVGEFVDRIGRVYGLDGTYADWAATPEAELRELLRIALIARVAPEPEPEKAEDYSALDAAFDAAFDPPPAQPVAIAPDPPRERVEELPISEQLPTRRPWVLPVVLVIMFVVGMLIAVAIRR